MNGLLRALPALCLLTLLSACASGPQLATEFTSLPGAGKPSRPHVTLTPARMADLTAVNDHVNTTIVEVSDWEHYGREDVWQIPTDGKGDCEDFALLKRKLLLDRGWPANVLSIAVGRSSQGEDHAVLAVATDRGELILDNLRREILPTERTGDTLLTRQQGKGWASATGEITSSPTVDFPAYRVPSRGS